MKSVFISHSSKDIAHANAVVDALEREGISVWIAPRDIPAGSNYGATITKGIRECAVLVLIFSKESNESHAVFREVQMAFEKKKIIIPLRIEDVPISDDLSFYLSGLHWLDAFPKQKKIDELVRDAKQVLKNKGIEVHKAPPLPQISVPAPPHKMLSKVRKVAIAVTSTIGILLTILLIIGFLFPQATPELTPEQEIFQAAEPTPEATPEPEPTPGPELEPEPHTWEQALEIAFTYAEARLDYIIHVGIFMNEDNEHGSIWNVVFHEFTPFGTDRRFVQIDSETMKIVDYEESLSTWLIPVEPLREEHIGWELALEIALEQVDTTRKDIIELWVRTWRYSDELVHPDWDAWTVDVGGVFFGEKVWQSFTINAATGEIQEIFEW